MLTQKTLSFLHESYLEISRSKEPLNTKDIFRLLKEKLETYSAPKKDQDEVDDLLRKLDTSYHVRCKTFQLTNMASDIVYVMMYIAIWANQERELDIDINIIARRKAVESELAKLLEKDNVHDRFGIRGIVLNNDSEEENIQKVFSFATLVSNVMLKNRKDFLGFTNWIAKNENIDRYTKERISYILSVPFRIEHRKDYITNPKEKTGYQSLHFVLVVEMFSEILPGADFEFQFRTNAMHQECLHGKASHKKYKEEKDEDRMRETFWLDDEALTNSNIVGLSSYNTPDDDIDGIHFAKNLFNRRISKSLVVI